jgi:glycosyltransferase involved in cell wall biosynthesis
VKTISIVVPTYNGENTLSDLTNQIADALASIDYELILVDDGSPDNSWSVIARLTKLDKSIVAIKLRKNAGQDNAIMAGLSMAHGEYVVIMDDDLQHSPYDIPALLAKCREGYDICYAHFQIKNQSWWKNAGSWLNGVMAVWLLHKPPHIYLSPFQIIKGDVVKELLNYHGPYPYIQGLLLQVTNNVSQIAAVHHHRKRGNGNFNIVRSFSVFINHVTSFSVIPLRLSSIIGFLVACIGFILSIYYIVSFFFLQNKVEGWTTLILTTLLLGGLTLMSIGIIGEYLGRVFLSINNKPQYSIKEILRSDD